VKCGLIQIAWLTFSVTLKWQIGTLLPKTTERRCIYCATTTQVSQVHEWSLPLQATLY
jgi:hypothetical protein